MVKQKSVAPFAKAQRSVNTARQAKGRRNIVASLLAVGINLILTRSIFPL